MGLRLVAHYYDRIEALTVSAALDAAGVPNWVENYLQNAVQPFHEIALGGFRLMVCAEDLQSAFDLIAQARAAPILDGGQLVSRPVLWEPVAWLFLPLMFWPIGPVVLLWVASCFVGFLLPLEQRTWRAD